MTSSTVLRRHRQPADELPERRRIKWKHVLTNFPLVTGGLIVFCLFLLVLFGPVWAPKNPYIAGEHILPYYDARAGEMVRPPLPPSAENPLGTDPWGADLLSLLMYGARNTLIACAFVTFARLLLGLLLGGLAGWHAGGLVDRCVMSAIGVISSVPVLLSSAILIYALDIRRGLPVFIMALAAVGWTEMAQYIRSQFLVLRRQPYVEGARAIGMRGLEIAVRQVLPNLIPQLLVITFLEMGAVLMLLGELGFVDVFIGGGSQVEIDQDYDRARFETLADVPEWGAMLAEGFRYLRTKPFVVLPPAGAFFVSVLGFNLFGEGLRRLVEKNALNTSFLLRKRMVFVIVLLVFGVWYILSHTGPAPWYTQLARSFDGSQALHHIETIARIEARGAGQHGLDEATEYIAGCFQAYGLQPGWKDGGYVYRIPVRLVQPEAAPELELLDAGGSPVKAYQHQVDFGFVIQGHGGGGEVEAPLIFVGFHRGQASLDWGAYAGLDLRGRIVLLIDGSAPVDFPTEALIRGARGVIWITDDSPLSVRSQTELGAEPAMYFQKPALPIFRVRSSVAEDLLRQDGFSLSTLLHSPQTGMLDGRTWWTVPLHTQVRMNLELSGPRWVEIPVVLGYMPGTDFDIADEIVVLLAPFDTPIQDPNEPVFTSANHSASGLGTLLELARLWQEQSLSPRRSVLFAAWGGSRLDFVSIDDFLTDETNFRHLGNISVSGRMRPAVVALLDSVGAGENRLAIHPASDPALARLLSETAQMLDVEIDEPTDAASFTNTLSVRRIPWIALRWAGPPLSPLEDRLERIEPERLEIFGKLLARALTEIVREKEY